ncbi:MAG: glutamine--fructose-6-phosphate transaminase (isomerizing) [Halobacteriovoraceae bacterium]|nr:glutamine--fructose-6-phosphate transaminase (isomerizing) [Halobacteriovoraceae bacterium]|tara:strand:- start:9433 stop:11244 length:1812 start_codon:yes stop_codon:yes gene_type:complete
MCGIVGFSGHSDAIHPIIEGLSRLEYRGYDSAGISYQVEGELKILKKEGKLENLKKLIEEIEPSSCIGIGHTRWATHGKVNDLNAHPHANDEFSIVHNGIIENANELREHLKKENFEFKSETDSECFLNLLTLEYKKCSEVKQAILNTFKQVKGNSAFVIIHKSSHLIYAIKKSAPLVCGINENSHEVYVSSDPYALVGFTTQIFFPKDNILCVGDHTNKTHGISFYDIEGAPSKNYTVQEKQMDLNIVSKGRFDHFMHKEIYEQPSLIRHLYDKITEKENLEALYNFRGSDINFIHIIGCGTAYHAGLLIKNFLEKNNRMRVNCEFASEFRYRNPLLKRTEAGLFISQSGETADTLACQELCKDFGLKTVSIVNVEGSTLFRECDANFLIHAGVEIGVASTKAFTQQVLVGYILTCALSEKIDLEEIKQEITSLAQGVEDILSREEEIMAIAREIYQKKGFIFTGRGEQFPIALEGALKLKEIAYVHAEGYASGELKHGPIALFDENMVNIAIVTPDLYDKTISNAQEVKARKGVMVLLGEKDNKELEEISDYYFGIDFAATDQLKPLLSNVFMQLLSYHIAKLKGTDIDKPRNLAKSVTVE